MCKSENLQCEFINPNFAKPDDINNNGVVRICRFYDMGWSTRVRETGRNYDSLNGFDFLGNESKRVIDYYTWNRKCRMCDLGHSPTNHDYRCNFEGNAKAMESNAAIKVTTQSKILKVYNVELGILIGDDSSTISALRNSSHNQIIKQSDLNHTSKGVTNELYKIKPKFKEMTKDVIGYFHRCFTYAVAQNRSNTQEMAKAIRNIPDHSYNRHENCGSWCGYYQNPESYKHNIIENGFKNMKMYEDLRILFNKLADNCDRFAADASSQVNESLNATMASKAPKSRCYSTSTSSDYRVACTVSQKNIGLKYIETVAQELKMCPGKNMENFVKKSNKKATKRAAKASLSYFKSKRLLLKKKKSALRNKKELSEGITYESNMELLNTSTSQNNLNNKIHNLNNNNLAIVYFDLETSSFSKNADILQLAAKCENSIFSVYIKLNQLNKLQRKSLKLTV